MKINSIINNIIVVLSSIFILTGCVTREPIVKQHLTGMKKNNDWELYNKYAEKENAPILDFMATTIMFKKNHDGLIPNYDSFLSTDPRVTIQTKWHNSKITDLYEFRFYMPDGRLFDYQYSKQKKAFNKWTIGRHIYLRGMPAHKINGKWNVKVNVNGKYVTSKSFVIGDNIKVEKAKPNIKIAFLPYWNSKDSTWSHARSTPLYIQGSILKDNKNVAIIPSNKTLKEIGNPQFDYNNFTEQLKSDLNDKNGLVHSLINKLDADYLIGGKVKSTWNGNNQVTEYTTYIIDTDNKKIINTIESKHYLGNQLINTNSNGMHTTRIQVYKALYNDLKDHILDLE